MIGASEALYVSVVPLHITFSDNLSWADKSSFLIPVPTIALPPPYESGFGRARVCISTRARALQGCIRSLPLT